MGFSASLSVSPLGTTQGQQFRGQLLVSGSSSGGNVFDVTAIVQNSSSAVTPTWAAVPKVLGWTVATGLYTASLPISLNFYPAPTGTNGAERVQGASVYTVQFQVDERNSSSASLSNTVTLSASAVGAHQ